MTLDIRHFILSHLIWVVGAGAAIIGGHAYLQERDARLTAEMQIYQSAQTIDTLKQQILDTNAKAAQQVQVIAKKVEAVKTPVQAVAAMPDVSALPVAIRAIPNSVDYLLPQVDVVPMFQQLAEGKKCAVELSACEANFAAGKEIVDQKDQQITALQKKPGFFHRVATTLKTVGVGVAIGVVLGLW